MVSNAIDLYKNLQQGFDYNIHLLKWDMSRQNPPEGL